MPVAITFDVGGTLAEGDLDKREFVARVLEYLSGLGFSVSRRAYKKALDGAMRKLRSLRARGREMAFEDFYSLVMSGLGITPDEELLAQLRRLYFSCFRAQVVPEAREVLEALSGRYRLAVISNSLSCLPKLVLEASGLDHYFEAILISGEVGWRKPHERIFRLALAQLGLQDRPGKVVHVGDSPFEDAAGAKAVGMKAVLLLRPGGGAGEEGGAWEAEPDLVIRSLRQLPSALEELDP